MTWLERLIVFLAFAVTVALVSSLLAPSETEAAVRLRSKEVRRARTASSPYEGDDLEEPLSRRLFGPLLERLQRFLLSRTPRGTRELVRARLREAGDPLSVGAFLSLRLYMGVFTGAMASMAFRSMGLPLAPALGLVFAYAGTTLPSFWLGRVISRRKGEIGRTLPEVLDLLCVSVEAGMGLEGAMRKVVDRYEGPLAQEMGHTLKEMNLGTAREEAWRRLSRRVNLSDLSLVVSAIVQTERLGAGLGNVLRIQTAELRERRRRRAEETARQIPIKLLFPLVLFIFPALFAVILGPAVIQIIHSFR